MKLSIKNLSRILVVMFATGVFGLNTVAARSIALPMTLDYPMLRSIIEYKAYTDPGHMAVVVDENDGCRKITISDPQIAFKDLFISFETKVSIRAGVFIAGKCLAPIKWNGYLELKQEAFLEEANWLLRFRTLDSRIYNRHHSPGTITGIIYKLIKAHVEAYLNQITINLAPPVSDLKNVIEPLFPPDQRVRGRDLVRSFRPGKVHITPEAVRIDILANVEEVYKQEKFLEALAPGEYDRFIDNWQTWDSFLVLLLTTLSDKPLLDTDRQLLLNTLLETRYNFVTSLGENRVRRDFVREQFVLSWKQLSPIFRKHLSGESTASLLGYLAFFTASDALGVFDKIGPTLGIEISRNGLIRMAKLLDQAADESLSYDPGTDVKLRKILGMDAPLLEDEIELDPERLELEQTGEPDGSFLGRLLTPFFYQTAWAVETGGSITSENVKQWIVTRNNFDDYLGRVRAMYDKIGGMVFKKGKIAEKYHDFYRRIVPSTAWQESCFRQFKVKKGKITYLRSYNNTSVGIMQINERVWRGIYDVKQLRWNIRYNFLAGSEILELYIRRYALRKMNPDSPLNDNTLARVVYAMYNGGPGQFKKFLKRHKTESYYDSDKLFWEKYTYIKKGDWDSLRKCLFGQE